LACEQAPDCVTGEGKNWQAEIAENGLERENSHPAKLAYRVVRSVVFFSYSQIISNYTKHPK